MDPPARNDGAGWRGQATLLIATAALLGASLIGGPYPREQYLQHGPTVVGLILLGVVAGRRGLSVGSFACVIGFLWLHILGARYIYSFVPYDDWARSGFGSGPSDWFDWRRNHYDRFVHLAFGVLAIAPLAETARRLGRLSPGWALLFALAGVFSISAMYEIFEWLLTIVAAPEDADSYNGQQGDLWDAQKDMALAAAGAVLVIGGELLSWGRKGSRR